jgi:hypothetical protein
MLDLLCWHVGFVMLACWIWNLACWIWYFGRLDLVCWHVAELRDQQLQHHHYRSDGVTIHTAQEHNSEQIVLSILYILK